MSVRTVLISFRTLKCVLERSFSIIAYPFDCFLITIFQGRECFAKAPTGSGKTLAFVYPMLMKLKVLLISFYWEKSDP